MFTEELRERSKRLVKYGFVKQSAKNKYILDKKKGYFVNAETKAEDYDPNDAEEEYMEVANVLPPSVPHPPEYIPTGYPKPTKTYRIIYESFNKSIEHVYFWIVDHCRTTIGFTRWWKVYDSFTTTESSSFFGNNQQRLGLQQDKVQQYLATIGKMIKDLFQLVRELRILDEKLEPRKIWDKSKSADATIKGEYIDLVENRGGQMNASSIYGLAQNIGYTVLPDLFFNTHVTKLEDVDKVVDAMDFNKNVKNVLKRKLYQYINWKQKTDKELKDRRKFTLKYLRQHWDVIQMYMTWIKPYLQHIKRLHMNEKALDQSIDLIGAFEQSMIEAEVIFGLPTNNKGNFDIAIISFTYRTRPSMNFYQEYQKGPVHLGQVELIMRAYSMHEKQIKSYIKMRKEENLALLSSVDESVKAAMEALGDELQRYLKEAGEETFINEDEDEEKKKKLEAALKARKESMNILEPFIALFKGISISSEDEKKKEKIIHPNWKAGGGKGSAAALWQVYKNFKGHMRWYKWG